MKKLCRLSRSHRKGSVTLELITIIPLVVLMCLVVWQFVVAGMAVSETQSMLKDTVRYAALTGDEKKAKKKGQDSFSKSNHYYLHSLNVKIEKGKAKATAKTKIKFVFFSLPPFTYESKAQAPVID